MKAWKLVIAALCASTCAAQAGGIDTRAVVGGAVGGGVGAAVGSAVGGREGAIIGAGIGGAAGAAVATRPAVEPGPVRAAAPVRVEREVVVVRDRDCWPPGHCKHRKHGRKHHD